MTEWNDNREQENMEAGPDGREEEQTPELEEQEDGRTERESLRYVYPGKKEPVSRWRYFCFWWLWPALWSGM